MAVKCLTDEEVTRVFRQGKTLFFDMLGVRLLQNRRKEARVGFSFSKKKVPLSVSRNRLRRQLLAALRERERELVGYDMIFYVPKRLEKKEKIDISGLLNELVASLPSKK